MSQIVGALKIHDLRDDSLVDTSQLTIAFSYSSEVSKPGSAMLTLTFGDGGAAAMLDAVGGMDFSGGPRPYLLEFSLDGGTNVDFRTLVYNPQDNLLMGQSGDSLWTGYMVRGVDRVTFHNVRLADAIYGAPGTIISQSFGTTPTEFGAGIPLQRGKGILYTTPGLDTWAGQSRLKYSPVIDPTISDILINSDNFAVMLPDALQSMLSQIAGVVIPGDPAPFGARGYWVEDSSGPAVNREGINRSIGIGRVGTTSKGHFTMAADSTDMTQAQIMEKSAQLTRSAHLDTIVSIYTPDGGQTNHGLPENATISSPVVLNTTRGPDSVDWDVNLCVFCATGADGNGGVYYWANDGIAYPLGQALPGATSLCYFEALHMLYVATQSGVYSRPAITDGTQWTRLGGLSAAVKRIVVELRQGGGVNVNVVAEVSGAGSGGDGLYLYPGLDDNGADYGYAGWSVLSQNAVSAWNYTFPGDTLITADPNDPSAVLALFSATDTLLDEAPTSRYLTPNGANVTALFTIPNGSDPTKEFGGSCVLTALGAAGMYLLDYLGHWTNLNVDLTLLDAAGNAPTVNSIIALNREVILDGVPMWVGLAASTAAGPYFSPYRTGGSWASLGVQSGVADVDFQAMAVGTPQTLINFTVTRMFAATSNGLYVSHSGGRYWDNETADLLSIGGYLTDLGATLGEAPFLANDVTSIGDILDGGSVGTSGRNVPGPVDGPNKLPNDLCWTRPLDERNKWVYKLVHTLTSNPYVSVKFGEVSEINTTAATGAKVACGRLALEMRRGMVAWSTPQLTLQIESSFADTGHFLRKLRALDLVTVSYDSTSFWGIQLSNTPMYVLQHVIAKGQQDTVANTVTMLGTQPRMTEITDAEIATSIQYAVSRQARYGKS